jgi:hypothetical protein
MEVLEQFAGKEHLGLGLDSIDTSALIYEGSRKEFGAGGRTRTDMRSEPRQILSLVRIPISPLRHF